MMPVRDLSTPEHATNGLQALRLVLDAIQECNLRCTYCHPGLVWEKQHLDVVRIRGLFAAVDDYGLLELVISGGEMTMHPQLPELLDATRLLERPTVTMITNGTLITRNVVRMIADSGVNRIVVSVDGLDNATHGSARGKNLPRVLEGLRAVQGLGREVTVVSVAHQGNFRRLPDLSRWLAEEGLAEQHHYCSPSYSGTAREHYPALRLNRPDYDELQALTDQVHAELLPRGFWVAFNSYWPVTGRRSSIIDGGRTITLQNLVEQLKDSLIHVRPNGDLRLATASWGRATVGQAAIGSILTEEPGDLLRTADRLFRSEEVCQLPRAVEARHKFQIDDSAETTIHTIELIDSDAAPASFAEMVPVDRLDRFDMLDNAFSDTERDRLAAAVRADPDGFRLVRHASGTVLVFNSRRSHVTLLRPAEWAAFSPLLAAEPVMR